MRFVYLAALLLFPVTSMSEDISNDASECKSYIDQAEWKTSLQNHSLEYLNRLEELTILRGLIGQGDVTGAIQHIDFLLNGYARNVSIFTRQNNQALYKERQNDEHYINRFIQHLEDLKLSRDQYTTQFSIEFDGELESILIHNKSINGTQ